MIHFALISYSPNTAAMNRMRGYWDVFEKNGVEACVTFLHQDNAYTRVQGEYKHVQFRYFKGQSSNKLFGLVAFHLHLSKFIRMLKKGDVVYTYGIDKVTKKLTGLRKVKVVSEITEHPTILDGGRTIIITPSEKYKVARNLYRLVVISESLKQHFISAGTEPSKIDVINMTVDPKRFHSLEKHLNECRYITYCGTASNNKDGVDELIKAFFIVSSRIDNVKLRIIGNTPSESDESGNQQLIRSMGIGDRIEFTGQISYNEVPQLLMDSDVLALDRPDSIQAQCGFPTKLGEYLLTGNPVVVTRVGDIPLFLEDGVSALLAEERNAQDFADKLLWALNNPDEASVIGRRGREVALKCFNSEIESLKLIKILQS